MSDHIPTEDKRMDPELKAKWVAALCSGKYTQGREWLCDTHDDGKIEHCCLGVLAEVAGISRDCIESHVELSEIGRDDLVGQWDSTINDPPFEPEKEWTWTTTQRRLAGMNDNGKSFAEIAVYIEQNL